MRLLTALVDVMLALDYLERRVGIGRADPALMMGRNAGGNAKSPLDGLQVAALVGKETQVKKSSIVFALIALVLPCAAAAQDADSTAWSSSTLESALEQQSSPAAQAQGSVEQAVRRFRIGVSGGVAFDPELINFGGHAAFGPIFTPALEVRPGVEFGLGEVTTLFGINVDVLYRLPGGTADTRWVPYLGGGPNFALSNRDLDFDDDDGNRFDFSDTDFTGGFNFIAGARNQRGLFFELKATAWGVSNVRLLAGFNF